MVSVSDAELCKAAASGADKFLEVIVDGIRRAAGDCLNAEAIMRLNGYQNALMAYSVFRDEVMEGGFIQLIQNGYGPYIFYNPFAKSMRLFGVARLAVLVNKANEIYEKYYVEFVKLFDCVCPFVGEEIWSILGHENLITYEKWPTYDESKLVLNVIKIAVQVNGKLRDTIEINKDEDEEKVKEIALKSENVIRHTEGKTIKKVIYVKNKIVNIVVI